MSNENGQGIAVDPQGVIDALMARVQQLMMENVMQAAIIKQLQQQETVPEEVLTDATPAGDR